MPDKSNSSPELAAFEDKYNIEQARQYSLKHTKNLEKRISNWFELNMARKALRLAGNPISVLDLPCGTGRFWPMLVEEPKRKIIAGDNSQTMIDVAKTVHSAKVLEKITSQRMSAYDILLEDNAVDGVFCMRLLHHLNEKQHRQALLKEFHRVTRASVCISLWVDGNRQARREQKIMQSGQGNSKKDRYVIARAVIEKEFQDAGFDIVGKVDMFKCLSMWRTYVLKKQ